MLCFEATWLDHYHICFVLFWCRPHLYWSTIFLSVYVSLSWDRTYIDRSFLCQFELRLHLYRSVIVLSILVWVYTYIDRPSSYWFEFSLSFRDCTYINQSFSCQFEFSGPHLYRSIIVLLVWVWVFGLHLYWSTIFLSIWVQFEFLRPHLYWSLIILAVWVFRTTLISISHCYVSLSFWDHTFIDLSFLCQFELGLYPYQLVIFLSVWVSFLGLHLYRSTIFQSVWVQFEFWGHHLYQLVISMPVEFELGLHLYRLVNFMLV